jgi:hypothetical protein
MGWLSLMQRLTLDSIHSLHIHVTPVAYPANHYPSSI